MYVQYKFVHIFKIVSYRWRSLSEATTTTKISKASTAHTQLSKYWLVRFGRTKDAVSNLIRFCFQRKFITHQDGLKTKTATCTLLSLLFISCIKLQNNTTFVCHSCLLFLFLHSFFCDEKWKLLFRTMKTVWQGLIFKIPRVTVSVFSNFCGWKWVRRFNKNLAFTQWTILFVIKNLKSILKGAQKDQVLMIRKSFFRIGFSKN